MKRVPILPTLIVLLAVAGMIALGLWQLLDRLPQKEAYLAQLAANPARPVIAFPLFPDESLLFRRAEADCRPPVTIRRAGAGAAGFRLIATCSVPQGSTQVQLGTTHDPRAETRWPGGRVTGYVAHAPESRSLIQSAFDHRPQALMRVAATPACPMWQAKQLSAIRDNAWPCPNSGPCTRDVGSHARRNGSYVTTR